jgi:hypothetical protein
VDDHEQADERHRPGVGKPYSVVDVLGPAPEAIEADIAHYYPGRSVAQYWRGQMSLRELRVLVTHLPPNCAAARALRGHHWMEQEYLLADLVDNVRFLRTEFAMSKGVKPGRPKPIPRPKGRPSDPTAPPAPHQVVASAAHQHVLDLVLPPDAASGGADELHDLPGGG